MAVVFICSAPFGGISETNIFAYKKKTYGTSVNSISYWSTSYMILISNMDVMRILLLSTYIKLPTCFVSEKCIFLLHIWRLIK